jgi:hypothetical protein
MAEANILIKAEPMNPSQLLALAVDKDLDIEKLGKLMELQRQWEADQNRKLFFSALADFQSRCPEIRKNKPVAFNETKYQYAPLADIERQIKDLMKQCGLTKRWQTSEEGDRITVTCFITHVSGHCEITTMSAKADDSGKKNPIQARGSSITYMQRYTLIGALGIGTADNDIDGRFTEKSVDELHKEYMKEYDQLIIIDPTLSKWHPDNWKIDRKVGNYVLGLGAIRKILFDLQMNKS